LDISLFEYLLSRKMMRLFTSNHCEKTISELKVLGVLLSVIVMMRQGH